MKTLKTICLAAAMAWIAPVSAQQAAGLDELLRQVEQGRVSESRENRQREQEFQAARADQQRLLREAQARKAREEARSEQLENTYEENEIRTAELQDALDKRLGSLKELFGVLRNVAGDTDVQFDQSLTYVQYPGRGDFLGGRTQ